MDIFISPEMIGSPYIICGLDLFLSNTPPGGNVNIYAANGEIGEGAMINPSANDLVYFGSGTGGWNADNSRYIFHIDFDSPYYYDGSKNLLFQFLFDNFDYKSIQMFGIIRLYVSPVSIHTHTYRYVSRVEPTASAPGIAEHYYCDKCGTYFDMNYDEISYSDLLIPYTNWNWDLETAYTYNYNITTNGANIYEIPQQYYYDDENYVLVFTNSEQVIAAIEGGKLPSAYSSISWDSVFNNPEIMSEGVTGLCFLTPYTISSGCLVICDTYNYILPPFDYSNLPLAQYTFLHYGGDGGKLLYSDDSIACVNQFLGYTLVSDIDLSNFIDDTTEILSNMNGTQVLSLSLLYASGDITLAYALNITLEGNIVN